MSAKHSKNFILLFLTALIWGVAFVAQSVAMDYIGPYTFNAVRSLLGGIVLVPCVFFFGQKKKDVKDKDPAKEIAGDRPGDMITGGILARYEAAFAAMPMLVTFIPMLTDTGGNAGSQSSTLIIRGMALGEIRPRDLVRVVWKETRVSLLVGAVLAAVNYVRLIITYPGSQVVALTVAISLLVTVLIAKTIGGVLPILARCFKADPAIMAAPLITTIVDAVSLMVYFSIAQHLLGL